MDLKENDPVSVNILITQDMFPLPHSAKIDKNFGDENFMMTNDQGEVIDVVSGQHMVLHMKVEEFVDWVKDKYFWLFDSAKNKFQKIVLKIEPKGGN